MSGELKDEYSLKHETNVNETQTASQELCNNFTPSSVWIKLTIFWVLACSAWKFFICHLSSLLCDSS